MMNVTLSKKQQQTSWGGLYLQYFEKLDKITSHSGGISVKKNLFIQKENANGNTLTPLAGQDLQVGDRICIRITVTNDQDMQFVHLKDLRAGCFEPTEQLSGNRWQDNLGYYQETTDVATNLFFVSSPKARTCSNTRYGLPKVGLIKMALPPYNVFMLHNIQRIVMPEALPFSKQKEKLRI